MFKNGDSPLPDFSQPVTVETAVDPNFDLTVYYSWGTTTQQAQYTDLPPESLEKTATSILVHQAGEAEEYLLHSIHRMDFLYDPQAPFNPYRKG